jgi:hypothetical protein
MAKLHERKRMLESKRKVLQQRIDAVGDGF